MLQAPVSPSRACGGALHRVGVVLRGRPGLMLLCGPNCGRVSVGRQFRESRLYRTAPVNNS